MDFKKGLIDTEMNSAVLVINPLMIDQVKPCGRKELVVVL